MKLEFSPDFSRSVIARVIFRLIIFLVINYYSIIFIIFIFSSEFYDLTKKYAFLNYFLYSPILIIIIFDLFFLYYFFSMIGFWRKTKYELNDDEVKVESDYFDLLKSSLSFKKILNVDYSVTWFLDKIFDTGTIGLYTSSSNFVDLEIAYIKNVKEVYSIIKEKILSKYGIYDNNLIEQIKPNVTKSLLVNFPVPIFLLIFIFIPFIIIGTISGSVLLIIIVLMISILILFFAFYILKNTYQKIEFNFYSNYLEYYDGFLTFHRVTIPYEKITDISVSQSFPGRILNYYRINIDTAGSFSNEISINYLDNGNEILKKLREIVKNG